jgi:hypothetical protein
MCFCFLYMKPIKSQKKGLLRQLYAENFLKFRIYKKSNNLVLEGLVS